MANGLKQFRQYLLGRHFVIRTDHMALLWLRRTPDPMPQLARWLVFIEQQDYETVHREARKHGNADELSRRLVGESAVPVENEKYERPIPKARIIDKTGGETKPQVRQGLPKRQQTDGEIGPIVRLCLT